MNKGINIPEYQVSHFNKLIKEIVETNFDYVRIRGEISDLKKASSGHIYLTLKDESSILNATIWSQKIIHLNVNPEIGMEVIVTGKISTYAKSISTYSINIDQIETAGEGALLKLIENRKKDLKEKGFFEETNKKKLPFLPKKIGVITSTTGSVIYDIINRIKDRFPTDIDIWPVAVQGTNAAEDIIKAIRGFNEDFLHGKPDVIIVARGGGSIEDLMPFNDAKLAIAVYHSIIPIVSAIGHETDTTIIDYVSDLRVSTPTAAAEKIVPNRAELSHLILNLSKRLNHFIDNRFANNSLQLINLIRILKAPSFVISSYKEKLHFISENIFVRLNDIYKLNVKQIDSFSRLLRSPKNNIDNIQKNLQNIIKDLNRNIDDKIIFKSKELSKFIRLLESNSLHNNLKKGYSIVRKSKKIMNKSSLINQEDKINIQFVDASIDVKIKKIN